MHSFMYLCTCSLRYVNVLVILIYICIPSCICLSIHLSIYPSIHTYIHRYLPMYICTYTYITLHYIALHCIALHCITLRYATLHYITLHISRIFPKFVKTIPLKLTDTGVDAESHRWRRWNNIIASLWLCLALWM